MICKRARMKARNSVHMLHCTCMKSRDAFISPKIHFLLQSDFFDILKYKCTHREVHENQHLLHGRVNVSCSSCDWKCHPCYHKSWWRWFLDCLPQQSSLFNRMANFCLLREEQLSPKLLLNRGQPLLPPQPGCYHPMQPLNYLGFHHFFPNFPTLAPSAAL